MSDLAVSAVSAVAAVGVVPSPSGGGFFLLRRLEVLPNWPSLNLPLFWGSCSTGRLIHSLAFLRGWLSCCSASSASSTCGGGGVDAVVDGQVFVAVLFLVATRLL